MFASELDTSHDDDGEDRWGDDISAAAALSMPWFRRRANKEANEEANEDNSVAAVGQGEFVHDYPSGERRDVWVTIQVPMNVERQDVREQLFPKLASIVTGSGATGVVDDDIAHVHSHFVIIGGIIVPDTISTCLLYTSPSPRD